MGPCFTHGKLKVHRRLSLEMNPLTEFKQRRDHDVMDEAWSVSPVTQRLRDKAWSQLGTSGSGNHFVEFGSFTVEAEQDVSARLHHLAHREHLSRGEERGQRGGVFQGLARAVAALTQRASERGPLRRAASRSS